MTPPGPDIDPRSGPARARLDRVDVVVLVHRDAPAVVARGLQALAVSMGDDWAGRVVLVQNGSPAATVTAAGSELARSLPAARVVSVASSKNLGFAAGVNLGVAQTTAPYVGLFNPDGITRPETVARLVRALERDGDAFMAGAQQVSAPVADAPAERAPEVVDWLPGTAVVFRRNRFFQIGGFDPGYFMYCEDVDLSRRARAQGWKLLTVPDAVFVHARGFDGPESMRRIRMWTASNSKLVYQYGQPRRSAMARLARQRVEWFRNLARQRRPWILAGALAGSVSWLSSLPKLECRRRNPWNRDALSQWLASSTRHVRIETREARPCVSGGRVPPCG